MSLGEKRHRACADQRIESEANSHDRPGEKVSTRDMQSYWIQIQQVVGSNSPWFPRTCWLVASSRDVGGAAWESLRFMLLSWPWMPDALLGVHLRGKFVFLRACLVQLGTALTY